MNNSFEKKAGIALVVFTILLVFTMVLHPAGGSVEHLISITGIIVTTHAIAILSLPFGWMGFWGGDAGGGGKWTGVAHFFAAL
jgi:protein-S-isoprenylcysteine O-methyltransferase Ste14